jgi:adenosine deaminase
VTAPRPTLEDVRRARRSCCTTTSTAGCAPRPSSSSAQDRLRRPPTTDADELGRWFRENADAGSLPRYLSTFAHTVGVMQTREALVRVARECAQDLADDGVVYAEVRFAPELHLEGGLSLPRSSRRCRRATGRAARAARSGSSAC